MSAAVIGAVSIAMSLAGVLDQRPFDAAGHRAWRFRAIGKAHPPAFWAALIGALREVGYTDVLSIENEDWMQDKIEGVTEAAAMMTALLAAEEQAVTA